MEFYFDGTGQRTYKEEDELEREEEEQLRPAPGKSSRTHGGGSHASGIPGKVSLTARLAQRIDRHAREGRRATPSDHVRALVAQALGSPSQPLSAPLRRELEQHADADLSGIRVHTDSAADQAARALEAEAFTVGQDIVFAAGAYEPDTTGGRRLVAHEVAHALQQRGLPAAELDEAAVSQPEDAQEQYADEFAGLFERKEHENASSSHSHGNGRPLPEEVRAKMERAFGADFSAVRVHEGKQAEELGALAYTQGTDIHFAPGQYDPNSQRGQELLGHELTHVVQQSAGRVQGTFTRKGVSINADPALEHEADAAGARATRGETAAVGGAPGTVGTQTSVQANAADPAPDTGPGEDLASAASTGVVEAPDTETMSCFDEALPPVQAKGLQAPIQAQGLSTPVQQGVGDENEAPSVYFQIHITRPMTGEEFKVEAMRRVFGAVVEAEWRDVKDSYSPEDSPVTLKVGIGLLKRHRGNLNKARGFELDQSGGIAGAADRAAEFESGSASDQKSALMAEIDRRYYAASGTPEGTKIKPGEQGEAELWRAIRDEVLFQHEYIAKLPPEVKELIRFSVKGRELTPADYDQLFRIAKKIENMPPGLVSDYASKVTGSTTDLDVFETALEKYGAEMADRQAQSEERETVQLELLGLEEVYKKYREYKNMLTTEAIGAAMGSRGRGAPFMIGPRASSMMATELEKQLQVHGFASITEFESFIKRFERAFEQEAANIAKDLLAKYAGTLYRESERYRNPAEISALYQQLGGFRTQHAELQKNDLIWHDYLRNSAPSTPPSYWHPGPMSVPAEVQEAHAKAKTAKGAAAAEIQGLSDAHPIFQEEGLPVDRRIDRAALAQAGEDQLGGLLQEHIQNRMKDIGEARAEIEGKPELIYKMDKLMPRFYVQQGIQPGSIYDMIIQDKMRDDAILKLAAGIALAIVAVALAAVTFGAATPAILAAGAGIAGASLSMYMAYDEYQEYAREKNLADVGLVDDPSVVWLVIAVVGAGLDMAAAVKAVGALGKAANALDAGGDLAEFTKAVRALEKANEIEAKVARAVEKAAAARKGFAEASGELTGVLAGKAYSFPGPLADPEVYQAVLKMARQAIKTQAYNAQKFIEELKLARVRAGLGDLTPEELAKAKQAWQEAKALETAEQARYGRLQQQIPDATKLDALIASAGDMEKLERLLETFPAAELETIVAQLDNSGRLIALLDHVGAGTGAEMVRQWMAKGKYAQMNEFMERLAGGVGKELAETAPVVGTSVVIDSQTAIALSKEAQGLPLQAGEHLMVKYIKSLPPGTELRAANMTIGEVGSGVVQVKGLPLSVTRDSNAYKMVLAELEKLNLGGSKGAADRAMVADAFFAKAEPGVVPQFATADKNVFNKLATKAGIDLKSLGGKRLINLYPDGFEVSIAGQKLRVVPIQPLE